MAGLTVGECLSRVANGLPVTDTAAAIQTYLTSDDLPRSRVIRTDRNPIVLDLSAGSRLYGESLKGLDVGRLGALIDRAMADAGTAYAFGRYGEPRDLYHSDIFVGSGTSDRRNVHMGVDLFCVAGTEVCAALDGTIEIVSNNTAELDYGPMLVLRHETRSAVPFYTLYGHLLQTSVENAIEGDPVSVGDVIANVGSPPENGNWPPHLHFQLISDLLGLGAGFPGVALKSQQDMWLALSPNPAVLFPEIDRQLLDAVGAA